MSGRKLIVVAASLATFMSAAVVTAPLADAKPKVKPPAKVAKAHLGSVTTTAASLSWKNPKSKNFKKTVVRIAAGTKAPKSAKSGRGIATVSKKKHAVTITRLAPGTVYTVGLFTTDGKKHYSKVVAVHLRTAVPPKPKPPAPPAPPAPKPTTGSISGTIFGGTSAVRLSGADVSIDGDNLPNSDTTSGPNGSYTFASLLPGSYEICANSNDKTSAPAGYLGDCTDDITVVAGVTSYGGDLTLNKAAGFSGVVKGVGGEKLNDVTVQAYDADENSVGSSDETGSDGSFVLDYLSDDAVSVCFSPSDDSGTSDYGYVGRCVDNLTATAGQLTPIIPDVTLAGAGAIAGTLTGVKAPANIPLQDVDVYAIVASANSDDGSSYDAQSKASGAFTVKGLGAGNYYLCFDATSVDPDLTQVPLGYVSACKTATGLVPWSGDTYDVPDTALKIAVTGAVLTPGKDATLQQAGGIGGTVTVVGGPAPAATVNLYSSGKDFLTGTDIAADGSYQFTGLAEGTYFLCVAARIGDVGATGTGQSSECYDNKPWSGDDDDIPTGLTPLVVTGGHLVGNVNVQLAVAGAFAGKVTGGGNGVPFRAFVYDSAGDQVATDRYYTPSADGSYTFGGLPAGTYHVCFSSRDDDGAYGGQCYKNVPWSEDDDVPTGLTDVVVTTGVIKSGVDATLPRL